MPLNLKKVKVLVVEDLQPMRSLIVSVLDAFGIGKIIEAKNGEQGYELFQTHNPDIIVTDWMMEPVDGLEFVRMVRQNQNSVNRLVPIIIMTGFSAMQRVVAARDLGATEFLTKPFTGRDLAKRINLIINRPRDFVETRDFFGPNRRRKRGDDYQGPLRRMGEGTERRGDDGGNKESLWEIVIE